MRTNSLLCFTLLFLVAACNRPAPPPPVVVGENKKEDEFIKPGEPLSDEIEAMTPVPLVPVEKLLPFLPPAPPGFTAGKKDGVSVNGEDEKYTIVDCDYRKDKQEIRVTIMDAGRDKKKYRPILRWVGVSEGNDEDYTKGVNPDGNPGWEGYDRTSKSGNMHLMVGKRYLVTIFLNGADGEMMHMVYKTIDVKGLAALK
jgi:hypothetical protein